MHPSASVFCLPRPLCLEMVSRRGFLYGLLILFGIYAFADGVHVFVASGFMKSHGLSMVPVAQELANRGHQVTLAIPAHKSAKEWFKALERVELLPVGDPDFDPDEMAIVDVENLGYLGVAMEYADKLYHYRDFVEKPLYSMYAEVKEFLATRKPDVAFISCVSFGALEAVKASPIPHVVYVHIAMTPWLSHDHSFMCNFPYIKTGPKVADLKRSFHVRLTNHMVCKLESLLIPIVTPTINAIRRDLGIHEPMNNLFDYFRFWPSIVVLGGPPFTIAYNDIPQSVITVGIVEMPSHQIIPNSTLEWLEAAFAAKEPVIYVSMGTKYKLTPTIANQLITQLRSLVDGKARVLWSLRATQQTLLDGVLPKQGSKWMIVEFTPQAEVLKHRSVKVFISHCGWGGTMDAMEAGVPVLAYPSFADQVLNAARMEELGMAIHLTNDFSNLARSVRKLMINPLYAKTSLETGLALAKLGGLNKTIDAIESAAGGRYLVGPPHGEVDPFFLQPMPGVIVTEIFSAVVFSMVLLWSCFKCCECYCTRACCGSRSIDGAGAETKKKQE